jgi:hypothetical protein
LISENCYTLARIPLGIKKEEQMPVRKYVLRKENLSVLPRLKLLHADLGPTDGGGC